MYIYTMYMCSCSNIRLFLKLLNTFFYFSFEKWDHWCPGARNPFSVFLIRDIDRVLVLLVQKGLALLELSIIFFVLAPPV